VLALAAFGAFSGAYVTTPIAARSAAGAPSTFVPLDTPAPSPTPFALVLPQRDPFAGGPSLRAASSGTTTATGLLVPPSAPHTVDALTAALPPSLAPLPPNAGAAGAPPPFTASASAPSPVRITAIVTGAHPFALVDDGGTTRLVTLGDRIGDDTVAAISAAGVRLTSGRTLPLTTDPPSATSTSGGRRP
jgi:hypothetical protein